MAEYIDREALRKILENWRDAHADVDDEEGCGLLEDVIREVDAQPAADVAPVVRCEDCKHLCVWNRKDIYAFCPKTNIVFLPFDKDTRTFFCGLGKRKDGGDG